MRAEQTEEAKEMSFSRAVEHRRETLLPTHSKACPSVSAPYPWFHPIPTGETQYHRYSLATDQAPLGSLERSTQDTRHVSRPALGTLLLVTTAPTALLL